MSFDEDDYDLGPHTVELLRLFSNGMDLLERGKSSGQNSAAVAAYIHSISNMDKGGVIIDLLTLSGILESTVLELKTREMFRAE